MLKFLRWFAELLFGPKPVPQPAPVQPHVRVEPGSRQVIPAAIALIERDEGCVLHEYVDIAGVKTIGFGHTGADVTPGEVITREAAEALAQKDIARFARQVDDQIGEADTNPYQFSAMVSLAYNIGDAAFGRSTVLRKHKAGDRMGAANAFLMWNQVHGHVVTGLDRRRHEERDLYLGAAS